MERKEIKEQLRKTRYQTRKETGKKYLTKGQLCEIMKGMAVMPKENKTFKTYGVVSLTDLVSKTAREMRNV